MPPPGSPVSARAPDGSFDHRDLGNDAASWTSLLGALPEGRWPPGGTPILVLAAHPDDETLGCGGILTRASDLGHPVTVIIATDGEASHPESATHSPEQLARIRRREASEALSLLAPSAHVVQLGLPDGQLDRHGDALLDALRSAIGVGPVWLLAPWEQDRHPDHAACARAARHMATAHARCTVHEYPIWAWHWADPTGADLPRDAMMRIAVGDRAVKRRRRALSRYRSQLQPLSDSPGDEPVLGPQMTQHFDRPHDVLIDPRGCARRSEYFGALFATSDDPWGMGSRWYEQRKRAILLACLPRRRFAAAFEPGCASGHLTAELARRCDSLIAADAAPRAVQLTRAATAGIPGVSVRRMEIPREWPEASFDLIVLSEIGYYAADLTVLADRLSASLRPDGVVVLCHWRHPVLEHLYSGDLVHQTIRERSGLHLLATHQEEDFLLDVLSAEPISVARADGIL